MREWKTVWARLGVLGVWSRDGQTPLGEIRRIRADGGHWLAFGPGGVPLGVGWRMNKADAAELVFRTYRQENAL